MVQSCVCCRVLEPLEVGDLCLCVSACYTCIYTYFSMCTKLVFTWNLLPLSIFPTVFILPLVHLACQTVRRHNTSHVSHFQSGQVRGRIYSTYSYSPLALAWAAHRPREAWLHPRPKERINREAIFVHTASISRLQHRLSSKGCEPTIISISRSRRLRRRALKGRCHVTILTSSSLSYQTKFCRGQ